MHPALEVFSFIHTDGEGAPPGGRLPLLVPPVPDHTAGELREQLSRFSVAECGLVPGAAVDETALRAGLFLWHDFLDDSHRLSQSIEGQGEGQLGDYWHAILHRREPDYGNSKYWFRQIGRHEVHHPLCGHADAILETCAAAQAGDWRRLTRGSKWDPFAFVDLCEACAGDETTELALVARRIQFSEMCLLMRATFGRFRRMGSGAGPS